MVTIRLGERKQGTLHSTHSTVERRMVAVTAARAAASVVAATAVGTTKEK